MGSRQLPQRKQHSGEAVVGSYLPWIESKGSRLLIQAGAA